MGYIKNANYSGIGSSSSINSTRGMVLLSNVDLTSKTSFALTSLINSSYKNYYFVWSNISFSLTDRICLQISTNNGSTWISSGYQSGDTSSVYNTNTINNNTNSTLILLSTNVTSIPGAAGALYLFNLQNGANFMAAGIFSSAVFSSVLSRTGFLGSYNAVSSVNALLITTLSGDTFLSGKCSLYGLIE